MSVLTGSRVAGSSAPVSLPGLGGGALYQDLPAFRWVQAALMLVQLLGLALATGGFLMGVGVLWTQLARALPLIGLFHHARALRALVLLVVGTGLLVLGRRR